MGEAGIRDPREQVSKAKRIVVKVGSAVLATEAGELSPAVFEGLASQIWAAGREGREAVLVSSGAIAAGTRKLGLQRKPRSIPEKQAAAAAGQSSLMGYYERAFATRGLRVAQVLLTHEDLKDRHRYLNARNTFLTLISFGVVPIVNENDTVAVDEIKLGDNDNLSALVAGLIGADLLIMLSDVDGLFRGDPRSDPEAELIPIVKKVDAEIEVLARTTAGPVGTGGMATKIQAAKTAAAAGVTTAIVNGRMPGIISQLLAGKEVGTLVLPFSDRLTSRKQWIAYALKPKGEVRVDDGAKEALKNKGKSLLASGILEVLGRFDMGECIEIVDKAGRPFARGLTNYSSQEVEKIKGLKSSGIEAALGYKFFDEVVHRDDLVLL